MANEKGQKGVSRHTLNIAMRIKTETIRKLLISANLLGLDGYEVTEIKMPPDPTILGAPTIKEVIMHWRKRDES